MVELIIPNQLIVVLGPQCSGKTMMARAVASALRADGLRVAVLDWSGKWSEYIERLRLANDITILTLQSGRKNEQAVAMLPVVTQVIVFGKLGIDGCAVGQAKVGRRNKP
jgi:pantothenate kinase-related protein Tda10